jgi:uncharacterized protein (DUF2147 family)
MTEKTRLYLRSTARIGQLLGGLCMYSAAACAQTPPMETGVWLDDSGSGAIEVYVCADRADRLCGRIVWLKEPLNAQGVPKRDRYNPKESLQTRPICGLPVLGNLAKEPEGGFDGGWIYDPKAGKSYNAAVQLARQDRLTVTGYLGMKFLGKSFVWTRAPADLQRCDGAPGSQATNAAKPASGQPKAAASAGSAPKSPASGAAMAAPAGPPPAPKPAVSTAAAAPTAKPATTAAKPPVTATAPAPKAAAPKAAAASGSAPKVSSTATTSAAKAGPAAKPVTNPATANKSAAAVTATAKPSPATATEAASAQPATTSAASKPAKTADGASDSNPIPSPFSWGGN